MKDMPCECNCRSTIENSGGPLFFSPLTSRRLEGGRGWDRSMSPTRTALLHGFQRFGLGGTLEHDCLGACRKPVGTEHCPPAFAAVAPSRQWIPAGWRDIMRAHGTSGPPRRSSRAENSASETAVTCCANGESRHGAGRSRCSLASSFGPRRLHEFRSGCALRRLAQAVSSPPLELPGLARADSRWRVDP